MIRIGLSQTYQKQKVAFGAKYKEVEHALFHEKKGSALKILQDEIANNKYYSAKNTLKNAIEAKNKMWEIRKYRISNASRDHAKKLKSGEKGFKKLAAYIHLQTAELSAAFKKSYGRNK